MFTEKDKEKSQEENVPLDYYSFFINEYAEFPNYEVKIFRKKRSTGGRYKKEYLGKFFDEPPEEDTIAEKWGPGDYCATSVHPKTKKLLSRDFSIAEDLRYLYKPHRPVDNFEPSPNAVQNAQGPPQPLPVYNPMESMKEVITGIVTPLVGLITTLNGNNKQQSNGAQEYITMMGSFMEGVMGTMAKGFGRMQTTMIENTIENTKKIQFPQGDITDTENAEDWGWVIELVKKFGGKIFDSQGNVNPGALAPVQNSPAFQEAYQDQEKLDSLYFSLALDKNIGKQKTDALFNSIGVEPLTDEDFNKAVAEQQKQK